MRKPEVGDRVVLKPIGNAARTYKALQGGEVTTVRRKLFGVLFDGYREPVDFYIDSMSENAGQYTSNWRAYFSEQEIADEERVKELASAIGERFRFGRVAGATLDQLERITAIIAECDRGVL